MDQSKKNKIQNYLDSVRDDKKIKASQLISDFVALIRLEYKEGKNSFSSGYNKCEFPRDSLIQTLDIIKLKAEESDNIKDILENTVDCITLIKSTFEIPIEIPLNIVEQIFDIILIKSKKGCLEINDSDITSIENFLNNIFYINKPIGTDFHLRIPDNIIERILDIILMQIEKSVEIFKESNLKGNTLMKDAILSIDKKYEALPFVLLRLIDKFDGIKISDEIIKKFCAIKPSGAGSTKKLNNFLYQIKELKIKIDFKYNLPDRLNQVLTGKNGYAGTLSKKCLAMNYDTLYWRDIIKLDSIEKIWEIKYDNITDVDQEVVKAFTQYVILCGNKKSISDLFEIFIVSNVNVRYREVYYDTRITTNIHCDPQEEILILKKERYDIYSWIRAVDLCIAGSIKKLTDTSKEVNSTLNASKVESEKMEVGH